MMVNRVNQLIYYLANASGMTSVATAPYQMTGLGVTNLMATQVNLASNTSPTFTVGSTTNVSGTPVVVNRYLTVNNGIYTMTFTLTCSVTTDASRVSLNVTLQDRTSTNSTVTDISGALSGANSSNIPVTGCIITASLVNQSMVLSFIPNGTGTHTLTGVVTYLAN